MAILRQIARKIPMLVWLRQRQGEWMRRRAARATFRFRGFKIPIPLMELTGGGADTFDAISAGHIANLKAHVGLEKDMFICEIGCGIGRDAIPLADILAPSVRVFGIPLSWRLVRWYATNASRQLPQIPMPKGRYVGIDIVRPSIDWCQRHISKRYPNFTFVWFDVRDQIFNPTGRSSTLDIRIPVDDASVDRIVLQSVFTHLFRPEIEHYLKEFRRILRPNGRVYATVFIYDAAILAGARATNLTKWNLFFEHEAGPGCRINDPRFPLAAVAYTRECLEEMIARTGMELVREPLKGRWSGYYEQADEGQDVLILKVPS